MSQASKRHANRGVKTREKVARFISDIGAIIHVDGTRATPGPYGRAAILREPSAVTFDVHDARAAATALVALEAEQLIFEDWTRERGLGPENRKRNAFALDLWAWAYTLGLRDGLVAQGWVAGEWTWVGGVKIWPMVRYHPGGGWPGNLAREYADEVIKPVIAACGCSRFGLGPCDECEPTYKRLRSAPMGRRLAQLGKAVLAAIEGQESGCQREDCKAGQLSGVFEDNMAAALNAALSGSGPSTVTLTGDTHDGVTVACPDCKGSGHNLRGSLPSIEDWAPVVRRKAFEALRGQVVGDTAIHAKPWLQAPYEAGRESGWTYKTPHRDELETVETRVVARGQHRPMVVAVDASLDARLTARGLRRGLYTTRLPRWRLGELKHAQQRRKRDRAMSDARIAAQPLSISRASILERLNAMEGVSEARIMINLTEQHIHTVCRCDAPTAPSDVDELVRSVGPATAFYRTVVYFGGDQIVFQDPLQYAVGVREIPTF